MSTGEGEVMGLVVHTAVITPMNRSARTRRGPRQAFPDADIASTWRSASTM